MAPRATRVPVRVPGSLRSLCGGEATLEIGLPTDPARAATVAVLLDVLATAHPALERRIRDEQGELRTHVNLFVGDENVRTLDGLATELAPGDELSILAAISGGSGSNSGSSSGFGADLSR